MPAAIALLGKAMSLPPDRFARQIVLPEIGDADLNGKTRSAPRLLEA